MKKLIGIIFIFLYGCAVGPNYVRPPVNVPAKFKEAVSGWKIAQPQDDFNHGQWWLIFHDPTLNQLEKRVNISNQNVALAFAQYQQARALVAEAIAAFFPTVSVSPSFTRQKVSTTSSSSTTLVTALHDTFNTFLLEGNVAWVPDIWGSVRRMVEASQAGADASAAQLGAVELSMQATLAQDYFQLRTLDADQKLLDKTVVAYRKALNLTRRSYAAGVSSLADIAQAETQLKIAEAQATDNHISRAQFEHAIAILIGRPPANFALPVAPLAAVPPAIPLQLPSALLERNPSVAQAERQVAQANAQIGVAIAAFFPVVDLTATGGYESNTLSKWFTAPSLFWSIGAQLTQVIFDGGLRCAQVTAATANYHATVANYREIILTTFQSVEDNLAGLRILAQEVAQQKQAVAAAQKALYLTLQDFAAGTAAYTAVIVAQNNLYATEKTAIDISGRRMTDAVGLIENLGGGWR